MNGNLVWNKTYGGIGNDVSYSVQQTTDGGYIIAGWTSSFGAGLDDVYLIKTDANGDSLWTKIFGGTGDDAGYSVQQTTDGGYIIAGSTHSFGSGNGDIYLIKTDANGNLLWSKTFGGTGIDNGYSVQQTMDDGYVIVGSTESFGAGASDAYLIKTDSFGNMLWTKTFGKAGADMGRAVKQKSDGGYIVSGVSYGFVNSGFYIIDTDSNGNPVWTKTYGGTNYEAGWSVQQTIDGSYIIAGNASSFGAGSSDVI